MKEIDARGLACPKPVVLTKKAMEENKEIFLGNDEHYDMGGCFKFGFKATKDNTKVELSFTRNKKQVKG